MEIKMSYVGNFRNNGNEYEVLYDESNKMVNLFYESTMYGDVECWSIKSAYVNTFTGKALLTRVKNCWRDFFNHSDEYRERHLFLQTFEKGFWNDVIVPIKNGKDVGEWQAIEE